MRAHLDALGWLHVLAGAFGLVTGASLLLLAAGAWISAGGPPGASTPAASAGWVLAILGLGLGGVGALMVRAGRSVLARQPRGRVLALWLGLVNLGVLPFGTALGIYTAWALLNDDARREFGRPLRGSAE